MSEEKPSEETLVELCNRIVDNLALVVGFVVRGDPSTLAPCEKKRAALADDLATVIELLLPPEPPKPRLWQVRYYAFDASRSDKIWPYEKQGWVVEAESAGEAREKFRKEFRSTSLEKGWIVEAVEEFNP